ncbi:hypothetical protein WMY93_004480 [Mugilogobius chulae]|uniref:L1 transposable element RRM domain-containing protein n=1 Tax=Mugilogobius chulae TaxID=88201 RepID=A0AAW0PR86_9GOBI
MPRPRKNNPVPETTDNRSKANELASQATCKTRGEDDSAMDPALQEVIRAVTENLTKVFEDKLKHQIDPISRFMREYQEQLQSHEERITAAETRISDLEDGAAPIDNKIKSLEKRVKELEEHADDLENRGRRKNIRIIGLPEGKEGSDPALFFETWLPELLNIEREKGVKVERAHRTAGRAPAHDQKPRPILVRLHNFRDKQRIMSAAWEKSKSNQPLKHGDATVMIFSDFSAAVVTKRKRFDEVKKRLKSAGAIYRMLYPALLKVTLRGTTKIFQSPTEVERFLETLD